MSPLLKAIGVGLGTFVVSFLIMWMVSRIMHQPFLPRFPQRIAPSPTPTQLFPRAP